MSIVWALPKEISNVMTLSGIGLLSPTGKRLSDDIGVILNSSKHPKKKREAYNDLTSLLELPAVQKFVNSGIIVKDVSTRWDSNGHTWFVTQLIDFCNLEMTTINTMFPESGEVVTESGEVVDNLLVFAEKLEEVNASQADPEEPQADPEEPQEEPQEDPQEEPQEVKKAK